MYAQVNQSIHKEIGKYSYFKQRIEVRPLKINKLNK